MSANTNYFFLMSINHVIFITTPTVQSVKQMYTCVRMLFVLAKCIKQYIDIQVLLALFYEIQLS